MSENSISDSHLPTGNGVVGSTGTPPGPDRRVPIARTDEAGSPSPVLLTPGAPLPPPAAALTALRLVLRVRLRV